MGIRGELFTLRRASSSDRRSYFFNVKENRNGDMFLNIVESKKNEESSFERHQVVIFPEDLEMFQTALNQAIEFMRHQKGGKISGAPRKVRVVRSDRNARP